MRGYLKKQKTAFGNIAESGLEVVYEQTDTSDLRPHECQRISARFCGIPVQRNWTGRQRTEFVSC